MENSLDKVECVPAPRGVKGPYPVKSNEYCIDLYTSYARLLEIKGAEETAESVKETAKYYCEYHKIDFDFHFNSKIALIVPPTIYNFQWHFAVYLMTFDMAKINALLYFQQKRYHPIEAVDFVTFIEFHVYRIVKAWSKSFDNSARMDRIMQWVDKQRYEKPFKCLYEQNKEQSKDQEKEAQKPQPKRRVAIPAVAKAKKNPRIIPPSFTLRILKANKDHFDGPKVLKAFESLRGGGFIDNLTQYSKIRAILSGGKIAPEDKINWVRNLKALNIFIAALAKGCLENKKDKWAIASKCFTKDNEPITANQVGRSNGKVPEASRLKQIASDFIS